MSLNKKIQLPYLEKEYTKHNRKINIGSRKVKFNRPTYQFPIQNPSEFDDYLDQIPPKNKDIKDYLIAAQFFGNEVQNGLDRIITNEGKLSSAAFRLASDLPSKGILQNKATPSYFFDNRRKFEGKNPILMRQNVFANTRLSDDIPKLPNVPGRFDIGDDPRRYRDMDIEKRLADLRNNKITNSNDGDDDIQRRLNNLRNPSTLPLPPTVSDNTTNDDPDDDEEESSPPSESIENRGVEFIEKSNTLAKEIEEENKTLLKEKQARRIYTQLPASVNTIEDVTDGKVVSSKVDVNLQIAFPFTQGVTSQDNDVENDDSESKGVLDSLSPPVSALSEKTKIDDPETDDDDDNVPTQLLLSGSVRSKALKDKFSSLMSTNFVNLNSRWRSFLFWLSDNYISSILLSNNMSIDILKGNIYVDGKETDDNIYQFIEVMNDQTKQEIDTNLSFDGSLKDFQGYLDLFVSDFDKNDISYSRYCKFLVAHYNFFYRLQPDSILKLRHSSVTDIDLSLVNIQRNQWTKFMIVLMNYYLKSEGIQHHFVKDIESPGEVLSIFRKFENNLRIIKQGYDHVFISVSNLLGSMIRKLPDTILNELLIDISTCTGTRIRKFPNSNEEIARLFIDSWYQYGALPPDIYNKVSFNGVPKNAFKSDVLYNLKNNSTQYGYIESITAYGAFCALAIALDKTNYNTISKCYIDWFNSFTYENISTTDINRLLVKHFNVLIDVLERSIDKYYKSKWKLISAGKFESKDDKDLTLEANLRSNISNNYTIDNISSHNNIPSTSIDIPQDNSIYINTNISRTQDEIFDDIQLTQMARETKKEKDIDHIPMEGIDDIIEVNKTGTMELYVIPDDKHLEMEVDTSLDYDISYQSALEIDIVNRVVVDADYKMSYSTLNSLATIPINSRFKPLQLKTRQNAVDKVREEYLRIKKDQRAEQINNYRDIDSSNQDEENQDNVIVAAETDYINTNSEFAIQTDRNDRNGSQQNQDLLDHLARVETKIHKHLIKEAILAGLITRGQTTLLLINPQGQYVLAHPDGSVITTAAENIFQQFQRVGFPKRLMIKDVQRRGFEIREEKSDKHINVKTEDTLNDNTRIDLTTIIPPGDNFEKIKAKIEREYDLIESNRSSIEKSIHEYLVKEAKLSGAIQENDQTLLKIVNGEYYLEKHRDDLIDQLPNRVQILDDIGATAVYSYEPEDRNRLKKENINVINVDDNDEDVIEFQQVKNEGTKIKTDKSYINASTKGKALQTIGEMGFVKALRDAGSTIYNKVDFKDTTVQKKVLSDIQQLIREQREQISKHESRSKSKNNRLTKDKAS